MRVGGRAAKVEIGTDGMPADPALRRRAVKIKYHMTASRKRSWPGGQPPWFLKSIFSGESLKEATVVWRALVASKTIVGNARLGYRFVEKGRLNPVDSAAKKANFEAVSRTVAERACSSPPAVGRCRMLFWRVRTLYGIHKVRAGTGSAVVVPLSIGMEEAGPAITEAFAVLVTERGLVASIAPRAALSQRFDGEALSLSVEPAACVPDPEMQKLLDESYVSPFTSRPSDLLPKLSRLARKSVAGMHPFRDESSAFVGETISPERWKSFMASLKRTSPLGGMFTRVLFTALDPETRRAAMRNPVGKVALYGWLCGGPAGGGRRRQASAAFPVFTQRLAAVEDAIDEGRELVPALSAALGLPAPAIRRLSGLTWQKLGREYGILAEGSRDDDLTGLLASISPERVPATRKEWVAAATAARHIGRSFGWPSPGSLALAASKDWEGFSAVAEEGLFHAISDTARAVAAAALGEWNEVPGHEGADVAVSRAVAEAVSGRDGGMKRLESFNARWHRGVSRRAAAMKAVRRTLFGQKLVSWKPLVESGSYESPNGVVRFLCDEDGLAFEGEEMKHCIGSYSYPCLAGASHVAAVSSASGSRSTVEFGFEDEQLVVRQHRAKFNADPHPDCDKAVEDFLRAAKSGLKTACRPEPKGAAAPGAAEEWMGKDAFIADVPDAEARKILDIYEDCLPAQARGIGPDGWRRLVAAGEPFRFKAADPYAVEVAF